MATFLDTNVLVYAFDGSDPDKQQKARQVLADPLPDPTISAQVLAEFYTVATTKLSPALSPSDAQDAVAFLSELRVIPIDARLVATAVTTSQRAGISFWDAQIIEAASTAGCEQILTEDLSDGQTISAVRIVNPFA